MIVILLTMPVELTEAVAVAPFPPPPEIVTDVSKGQFQATAVAGTAGRGHDKKEQQTLAESLLGSTKDGIEHCITRDDILTRLGTLVDDVDAQVSPHVLTLGEMQHLETVKKYSYS